MKLRRLWIPLAAVLLIAMFVNLFLGSWMMNKMAKIDI